MSELQKKIDLLIDEANAHYETNRYKDAAKTFSHLVDLALQNNDPEEAVYFCYRITDCWKKANEDINRAKGFKILGEISLRTSALIAERVASETKDQLIKANTWKLAGESYYIIDKEKSDKSFQKSTDIYEKLVKKEKKIEQKLKFYSKILEIAELTNAENKIKDTRLKILELKKDVAKKAFETKTQESLSKALREYEDILQIYEKLKETQNTEEITSKIEEIKKLIEEYDPFAT